MEVDEATFETALTVAQQFANSFETVPRQVKLTALAILIAGTFKAPDNGLQEFRCLVDALINQMNRPPKH